MTSHERGACRSWGPIILGLCWALGLWSGCSGKLPDSLAPSSCSDRCGSLTCPPDTHCSLTGTCSPSCVPDTLAPR
jgi:hypothetical protein